MLIPQRNSARDTYPENVPPSCELRPRDHLQPFVRDLKHVHARRHQFSHPRVPLHLHRAIRQPGRLARVVVHVRQKAVRERRPLPLELLPAVPPVVVQRGLDVREATRDQVLIHRQETREGLVQVEVVRETDDGSVNHNVLCIADLNVETAAQVEAFPGDVAVALDREPTRLEVGGCLSAVALAAEAESVVVADLLRNALNHIKSDNRAINLNMVIRPTHELPI